MLTFSFKIVLTKAWYMYVLQYNHVKIQFSFSQQKIAHTQLIILGIPIDRVPTSE